MHCPSAGGAFCCLRLFRTQCDPDDAGKISVSCDPDRDFLRVSRHPAGDLPAEGMAGNRLIGFRSFFGAGCQVNVQRQHGVSPFSVRIRSFLLPLYHKRFSGRRFHRNFSADMTNPGTYPRILPENRAAGSKNGPIAVPVYTFRVLMSGCCERMVIRSRYRVFPRMDSVQTLVQIFCPFCVLSAWKSRSGILSSIC